MRPLLRLCTLAAVAVLSMPATAGPGIYMNYDGIEGEALAEGYERWIAIESFSFQLSHASSDSRTRGTPILRPILISKQSDASSIPLYGRAFSGAVAPRVDIHFVQSGAARDETYWEIILSDVTIVSAETAARGDSTDLFPADTFALSYGKVDMKWISHTDDGRAPTTNSFCWDAAANSSC